MPKNVLFSLKNCKNRQKLGALLPDPLAFGGSAPRPPHQSPNIVNSFLCIYPQSTDYFGIDLKTFFLVIAGVHQAFGVEKLCCISYTPQTTEMITIDFNFFRLVPHSFCAGAAPEAEPDFW